jgi:hypothetical protein
MATKEMIISLSEALIRAKNMASRYADKEDSGTCNFDTPQINLVGWKRGDIEVAFRKAGLICSIQKTGEGFIADIIGCSSGQGSRRTQMAEAVRDSLKSDGYEAFVYYQMD